jgi:enoyl-CoA hydratase
VNLDVGSSPRWSTWRRTPVGFELAVTAAPMPAECAYQVGVVSRLTGPGHSLDAALEVARAIVSSSPAAESSVKAGSRRTMSEGLDPGCAASRSRQGCCGPCRTAPRGIQAFLGRRPPVYPDAPVDLPGL